MWSLRSLQSKTSCDQKLLCWPTLEKNNSDEIVKAAENYCFRYGSQLESRLSFAWEWEDAPQKVTRAVLGTWLCKLTCISTAQARTQCMGRGIFSVNFCSEIIWFSCSKMIFRPGHTSLYRIYNLGIIIMQYENPALPALDQPEFHGIIDSFEHFIW